MDKTSHIIHTPVGLLQIQTCVGKLCAILWEECILAHNARDVDPVALETERQLQEYFQGKRQVFDLPLYWEGTPFQVEVWQYLTQIPYGCTASYKEVANATHRPKAMRAVGAAIGKNPLSIVVACHRVIGSDGSLTGFAGGLARKQFLLELENPPYLDLQPLQAKKEEVFTPSEGEKKNWTRASANKTQPAFAKPFMKIS